MKQSKNHIFGRHPIAEAIQAGTSIDKIMIQRGVQSEHLLSMAKEANIPVQQVPEVTLSRLSGEGNNHQGVMAIVAAITYQPLEDTLMKITESGEMPLLVMLDGVTDVRNFGAVVRSAECMGAHAIIVATHGAAPANGAAVKTSAGALFHLPICREQNLQDVLMILSAYDIKSVACTEKSEATIYDQNLSEGCCLILGSEENGISKAILKRADVVAGFPMKGEINSLNVSVAAGMALSEAARQRA